jgi:nucleotide-binding universal stress UspA family protein
MRILFVADEEPHTAYALEELARLSINTWADVIFLGVSPEVPGSLEQDSLMRALKAYRDTFLERAGGEDGPYAMNRWQHEWMPTRARAWEQILVCRSARKDLRVRFRAGVVASEILTEASEQEVDLIVMGCPSGSECRWGGSDQVHPKVLSEAGCSVLLVKDQHEFGRIVACLDQSYISQDSLEIINQMATIHKASVELVGLSGEGSVKRDVYRRIIEIGDYFEDRQIKVEVRVTDVQQFEKFLEQELREDLVAIWAGKRSLIDRLFPREWVGRFASKWTRSSLVMR